MSLALETICGKFGMELTDNPATRVVAPKKSSNLLNAVCATRRKLTPLPTAPQMVVVPPTHVIEITVTWLSILPMPADMRIRLLGKSFFNRGF